MEKKNSKRERERERERECVCVCVCDRKWDGFCAAKFLVLSSSMSIWRGDRDKERGEQPGKKEKNGCLYKQKRGKRHEERQCRLFVAMKGGDVLFERKKEGKGGGRGEHRDIERPKYVKGTLSEHTIGRESERERGREGCSGVTRR